MRRREMRDHRTKHNFGFGNIRNVPQHMYEVFLAHQIDGVQPVIRQHVFRAQALECWIILSSYSSHPREIHAETLGREGNYTQDTGGRKEGTMHPQRDYF